MGREIIEKEKEREEWLLINTEKGEGLFWLLPCERRGTSVLIHIIFPFTLYPFPLQALLAPPPLPIIPKPLLISVPSDDFPSGVWCRYEPVRSLSTRICVGKGN